MVIVITTKNVARYPTCGDYYEKDGIMYIDVYEQGDDKKNLCIALHELCEAFITKWNGISEQTITDFDIAYEKNRIENESEPGDDPNSPYRLAHRFSENMERQLAYELGLDWNEYNDNLKVYDQYNIE